MEEFVYHANFLSEDTYWWFTAREKIILSLVEKFCPEITSRDTVVDIGCGTGGFLSKLAERYVAIGTDMSETALGYCRKRGLTRLYNTTVRDFPRESEENKKIRAVFMLDVIEHIEDDQTIVQEVYDLLEPGGYFIAAVPAFQWLFTNHDRAHMHYRRYNRKQFTQLFVNAGFSLKKTSYFNFLLFLPAVISRFLNRNKVYKTPADALDKVSPLANSILHAVFAKEASLLQTMSFPFGLSLVIIAQKK